MRAPSSGEMPRLKGIAGGRLDTIWITDAILDQVAVFRTDGEFLMAFGGNGDGPAQFSFPAGIAAHRDGRIAVVDSLNRRVQTFSTAGLQTRAREVD